MRIIPALLVLLVGCGAPVLRNAPHPDNNVMAAASLGTAIAMVLRDPQGWAHAVEQAYLDATPIPKPMRVTEIVPEDVFDRLDAQQAWDAPGIPVDPGDAEGELASR